MCIGGRAPAQGSGPQGRVDGMVDGAVGDIPMRDGRPLGDLKRCAGEAHLVVGISVFV